MSTAVMSPTGRFLYTLLGAVAFVFGLYDLFNLLPRLMLAPSSLDALLYSLSIPVSFVLFGAGFFLQGRSMGPAWFSVTLVVGGILCFFLTRGVLMYWGGLETQRAMGLL